MQFTKDAPAAPLPTGRAKSGMPAMHPQHLRTYVVLKTQFMHYSYHLCLRFPRAHVFTIFNFQFCLLGLASGWARRAHVKWHRHPIHSFVSMLLTMRRISTLMHSINSLRKMNEFALQLRERRSQFGRSATLCGDRSEFSLVNRRTKNGRAASETPTLVQCSFHAVHRLTQTEL